VNAEPTWAVAVPALEMTGVAGLTVNVKVVEPVPVAFVAEIVTELIPTEVGEPLITPVAVSTLNPAGKPIALKEVGVPMAVME